MRIQQSTLLAVSLMASLPLMATAQADPAPHPHGHMQPGSGAPMHESCEAMMAEHQAMKERMQAMDAELDRLVAEMSSASGDAKVEATAAVVQELVAQRKSMHETMMRHQPMMMHHMMEHLGKAGEGMSGCPMMKQMQGDAEADEHSTHHPEE